MANCPAGYTTDQYGNCVYSPVDYNAATSFTGAGTGTVLNPQQDSELWQIKQYFDEQGVDWADYATYFELYEETPLLEKE